MLGNEPGLKRNNIKYLIILKGNESSKCVNPNSAHLEHSNIMPSARSCPDHMGRTESKTSGQAISLCARHESCRIIMDLVVCSSLPCLNAGKLRLNRMGFCLKSLSGYVSLLCRLWSMSVWTLLAVGIGCTQQASEAGSGCDRLVAGMALSPTKLWFCSLG